MAQDVIYDPAVEVRPVGRFSAIQISGAVSVHLSQDATSGLAISAGDSKYNNKIKTEVKGDVLHISVDGGFWNGFSWGDRKLNAWIAIDSLKTVTVSGASELKINGAFTTGELTINVNSASAFKGAVSAGTVRINAEGASEVRLSGDAHMLQIESGGASKINTENMVVNKCVASANGASVVRVHAGQELTAHANGGSVIHYKGNPGIINAQHSTGANIKKH